MKLVYPSTARNRQPILDVLRRVLPDPCTLLEIASGSGEHALFFTSELPGLTIQPSDPDPAARASVDAWRADVGAHRIRAALDIDVSVAGWPDDVMAAGATVDAILAVNMIHIAPREATRGLLAGAGMLLQAGAPLVLYGPWRRANVVTAASNEAFDHQLRSRDPRFGLRHLEEVMVEANEAGFALEDVVEMPSNNLTVVFQRR
jgi:hypothetical protein